MPDDAYTVEWVSWSEADKANDYPLPTEKLVNEERFVAHLKESGIKICGNCHQYAGECAPVVNGTGLALTMRQWGGLMNDAWGDPENDMGYCRWAWGNPDCSVCGGGQHER